MRCSMSATASFVRPPLRAEDDLDVGVADVQVAQDRGLAPPRAGQQRQPFGDVPQVVRQDGGHLDRVDEPEADRL